MISVLVLYRKVSEYRVLNNWIMPFSWWYIRLEKTGAGTCDIAISTGIQRMKCMRCINIIYIIYTSTTQLFPNTYSNVVSQFISVVANIVPIYPCDALPTNIRAVF
jgi:hypothetical protein